MAGFHLFHTCFRKSSLSRSLSRCSTTSMLFYFAIDIDDMTFPRKITLLKYYIFELDHYELLRVTSLHFKKRLILMMRLYHYVAAESARDAADFVLRRFSRWTCQLVTENTGRYFATTGSSFARCRYAALREITRADYFEFLIDGKLEAALCRFSSGFFTLSSSAYINSYYILREHFLIYIYFLIIDCHMPPGIVDTELFYTLIDYRREIINSFSPRNFTRQSLYVASRYAHVTAL